MPENQDWSQFNLSTPSVYHIKIRGCLDDNWSNRLGGMEIQHKTAIKGAQITALQGTMVDQAALFGVLNSLYGLGFPILSVDCTPASRELDVYKAV